MPYITDEQLAKYEAAVKVCKELELTKEDHVVPVDAHAEHIGWRLLEYGAAPIPGFDA